MSDPTFDFVTPEDQKDLREALNNALKDHAESLAWARITLSRSDARVDIEEAK